MPINVFPFDVRRDEDGETEGHWCEGGGGWTPWRESDCAKCNVVPMSLHDEFMEWLRENEFEPDALTRSEQAELAAEWATDRDETAAQRRRASREHAAWKGQHNRRLHDGGM